MRVMAAKPEAMGGQPSGAHPYAGAGRMGSISDGAREEPNEFGHDAGTLGYKPDGHLQSGGCS